MRQTLTTIALLVSAVAMLTPTTSASMVETYGDFTVDGPCIDTCITLFDSGTNPPPFPSPVALQLAATYPAVSSSLTVSQMQAYLSGQGYDPNNFLVIFKIGEVCDNNNNNNNNNNNKSNTNLGPNSYAVCLQDLEISIGGTDVADGQGQSIYLKPNTVRCFNPKLNLSSYPGSAKIEVAYIVMANGLSSIEEIKLGATPEPVSMAFLGTGFLGTILIRRKRKKT